MKRKSRSEVAQLCPNLSTSWTAAYQAPPSMGFSRQEYWSAVPLPSLASIVWHQVNNREGTQPHPSTGNWIKDLLNIALPIRTRPNLSLSQSLPSESFHKLLILLHQEGRQTENHNHRKLTNLITWTTALSNSVKTLAVSRYQIPRVEDFSFKEEHCWISSPYPGSEFWLWK